MYELMWFLGGALLYSLFSSILSIGHSILFFQKIQMQGLKLLGNAAQDLSFLKTLKYKTLKESNVTEEQIKVYQEVDEYMFQQWTTATIENVNSTVPPSLKKYFVYKNWAAATSVLNKFYREERDKELKQGVQDD